MEIFQARVRHIVLTLKSSEEKQKECKEKLTNTFRTLQQYKNDPIANKIVKSYSGLYIKNILIQLREADERNKSTRKCLQEILIKIKQHKFENFTKADEVFQREPSSENLFEVTNIHQSQHVELYIDTPTIQADKELTKSQESLVKFKNFLITTIENFIGETMLQAVYLVALSCKLPEWRKIKCKIK